MAVKDFKKFIDEAKDAKYFNIMVDSTSDILHMDQLSIMVRYVAKDGIPVDHFVYFVLSLWHKSKEIIDATLKVLDKVNLDVTNCRAQSYDNDCNIAGVYLGDQAGLY